VDVLSLHADSVDCWVARVRAVPEDCWSWPTPCTDWSVHDLVNHVVGEDRWTVPLLAGATIAEVGSRYDGDILGADPVGTAVGAAEEAVRAAAESLADHGTVHLSYGEESAEEYLRQLAADHLIHAWDLAVATGGDASLPTSLVDEVTAWFAERRALYASAGLIGHPFPAEPGTQDALVGAFGRRPAWGKEDAALARFARAFASGDVDTIMALMTDDCVFESTAPAPDGQRVEGSAAVRAVWEDLFTHTLDARFTTEEMWAGDGRGVLRWRFDWTGSEGEPCHVRGVDAVKLREGKVSEKLSYVKG